MSVKINLNEFARVSITSTGLNNLVRYALNCGYKSDEINEKFDIQYINSKEYIATCVCQMKEIQEILGDNKYLHAYNMYIEFLGEVEDEK